MKCDQCARPDSPCLGERLSHLCRHPAYREYFSTYEEGAAPATARKFDRDEHTRVQLLILGCDYRGPRLACGCNATRICLMGKGRPVPGSDARDVTHRDCETCVTSS